MHHQGSSDFIVGRPVPSRRASLSITDLGQAGLRWVWICLFAMFAAATAAQQPLDEISRRAAQLEAELGKYNDATTEAADVMVRLIDLYHADARVFGLVRVGNRFVSTHPSDPRHQQVMLKTIDGLQAMSRNKDMIVACRQFLFRYPQAKECADIERRLADTLACGDDKKAAAAAYHAVWKRQGNNQAGRQAAIRAIRLYHSMGNNQVAIGAELAEQLLDVSQASLAADVGSHSVFAWARAGKWAESNRAALKLLKKKVIDDPQQLRSLHMTMAENYHRLGQHSNSARSYAEARKIEDDQVAHLNLINQLDYGKASSQQIAPVAKDYATRYSDREDRFRGLSILAQAYLRENNPGAATTLLSRVLSFDAVTNDAGRVFVNENGSQPDRLKETEKVLRDAIRANPNQAAYLRYVLAFSLYRDRMKDNDRTRRTLEELIEQSPSDDGYTRSAVNWLLDSATDEEQFDRQLSRILEARQKHPQLPGFARFLADWRQSARRDPRRKDRARRVEVELEKADRDRVLSLASRQSYRHSKQEAQVRDQLLKDDLIGQLDDDFVNRLLETQGYYYRHYVGGNQRKVSADYYGRLAKRLPKDFDAARRWLESATDYATPEVAAEAALHVLSFPPHPSSHDVCRRLMVAADKNKDKSLGKKSFDWLVAAEKKFGRNPRYASYMGDVLSRLGLAEEAKQRWTTYLTFDRNHSESRECAWRLLQTMDESEHLAFIQDLLQHSTPFQGRYATWLADHHLKKHDYESFAKTLQRSRRLRDERPLQDWDLDVWRVSDWVHQVRRNNEATDEQRRRVYSAVKSMDYGSPSAAATLALFELGDGDSTTKMERILLHQSATCLVDNQWNGWDALFPYAQSALARRDYIEAATIASGLLANISRVDDRRLKAARDVVTQSYARMGSIGLTIDEDSPIAPLLQAALYLRLGDEKLALATYDENRVLFDRYRDQLPIDLITFVCRQRIAGGGDANHDFVEDVLRQWMVRNSESAQVDDEAKAEIQLLLAKNYYKARRYDVARSEFTTTINRYPESAQAVEAKFGIGESFMSQKVYDQAELVFEELARSHEMDVVVRAEFLRGVLAFRRGDRDDARDIFRSVLERVPNVDLANQALFNLSEVYGSEQRYIDQLNLLRTVGRLGRKSTRFHAPGMPLSIVVHDSDLGISRGHNKIPVIVTTRPSGDSERIFLTSAGAGRGLFRADVDTRLGDAQPGDKVLQLVGSDTIECDYPDEFKSEFKKVPLSDVEIRIAASAEFKAASSKVTDEEEETFSERVAREAAEQDDENADLRISQQRPENQIKPGNDIHLRVIDGDRDLSSDRDRVPIKMVADSGDNLQVMLSETGPHTGIFEGTAATAELPAGALASDTAINHSPLMAIDLDEKSYWLAEPDGATPKSLTIDMKDLREIARVRMKSPDAEINAPVRTELLGSYDGEFWFRLAGHPRREKATRAASEFGRMQQRVYRGRYHSFSKWYQVADLGINRSPVDTSEVDQLAWSLDENDEDSKSPHAVIWSGQLVQRRSGAVRISVRGLVTAMAVGDALEIPVGKGNQSADLWLDRGKHDLTIFAATDSALKGVEATIARSDLDSDRVVTESFRAADFDLDDPAAAAKPAVPPLPDPINLPLSDAKLQKTSENFGQQLSDKNPLLNYWSSTDDTAAWEVDVQQPGAYEVWMNCSHPGEGSRMVIEVDGDQIAANVPDTRDWKRFQDSHVATLLFESAGRRTLTFKPTEIASGGLMDLKGVTLKPAAGPAVIIGKAHWDFRFPAQQLRYVRMVFHEYLGESVAVAHVEIGGKSPDQTYIPTDQDVLALASNDALEIAAGDTVTATYTDEFTQNGSGSSQRLSARLTATYNNAEVTPITYEFVRVGSGQVSETRLELKRIDLGERLIVEIRDYDEDRSGGRDEIEFEVFIGDGEPTKWKATETEEYSGVFTKEVDTSAGEEPGKLKVAAGDRIYLRYIDSQNTFPGHSVPRESVVYVTQPSEGSVRILESRAVPRDPDDIRPPVIQVAPAPDDEAESRLALDAPLTIEVIDPDRAKNAGSTVKVAVLTSEGSAVIAQCAISNAFDPRNRRRGSRDLSQALEEGRFVGQVNLQLGGKNSPQIVPRSPQMPRNLIGNVLSTEKNADDDPGDMVVRVLNLSGKDTVTAAYNDKLRPDGMPARLSAQGKLVSNGRLKITDREYKEPVDHLHVGERIYLSVQDPDRDTSDDRDTLSLQIATALGEQESVQLTETLAHSGVFTGSFLLQATESPTPANLTDDEPVIECYFGDTITATYNDPDHAGDFAASRQASASPTDPLKVIQEIPVVVGTNGLVAAFTKTFNDETLAVETKFRIAESYFELFKSHKELERSDEQRRDLEAGRRVLREVMEDYPDPKYTPRISYLLGQFAQELEQWNEAIKSYELIIRRFPDHTLAADAHYKLAQSYEEAGDFDEALEAYVTLAATHPNSPLIASVMIRISDYFYKNEQFDIAAQVGEKFGERFEGHEHAAEMAFRVGQCYYKVEDYQRAGVSFDEFAKEFPDDELGADSLFWSGEAYRLANNNREAFRRYNRCRWDYPESEAAKYARGRLALPEMLQQFEAEANSVDDE